MVAATLPVAMNDHAACVKAAKRAGLRYVSDDTPGIERLGQTPEFRYVKPRGRTLSDPRMLKRIQALAIPPAWTDVWICPDPLGHMQATGRDARGRKQYRYHERWRSVRDENKFTKMIAFAQALPRIRRRVKRDLQLDGLPRRKVLATVVRLLETTMIRVGNEEYARQNRSYGLTTLRNPHAHVKKDEICFEFRGKSGVQHRVTVQDRRLARIVRQCQELPGQELFQYLDDEGKRHTIGSADVNAYLQDAAQGEFTAKDFRTWAATLLAARSFQCAECNTKKQLVQCIRDVATQLGNTVAVCRKCYIHPDLIESYLDGTLSQSLNGIAGVAKPPSLRAALSTEETALLHWLQMRKQKR